MTSRKGTEIGLGWGRKSDGRKASLHSNGHHGGTICYERTILCLDCGGCYMDLRPIKTHSNAQLQQETELYAASTFLKYLKIFKMGYYLF